MCVCVQESEKERVSVRERELVRESERVRERETFMFRKSGNICNIFISIT